jgi:hypothetical protein
MSLPSSGQPDLNAKFAAALPYLPRTAQAVYAAVASRNIGAAELAAVCRSIGDDLAYALTLGVHPVTFLPHLKSMVMTLRAGAVLATGQSFAWQIFSTGLTRMTMGVTPQHFYALANELAPETR